MFTSIEPGMRATRTLIARAVAGTNPVSLAGFAAARKHWTEDDRRAVALIAKGDVGDLNRDDVDGINGPADLMQALRPLTIVGRLPLRRVPPLTSMLTATTGARGYWVQAGGARRLSVGAYARDSGLKLLSVSAISVASRELLEHPSGLGEAVITSDLLAANALALDEAFIDADNLGDDGTPASITSGVTPIFSAGSTVDAVDADLRAALAQLTVAGSTLQQAHWIMSPTTAAWLGTLRGVDDGAPAYPDVGVLGGTLLKLPVITSAAIGEESDGDMIVLVDPTQIAYADELPAMRTSSEAMVEMSDTPTGDTIAPASAGSGTKFVSLFQVDATALLVTHAVNWKPRRAGMVAVIRGVDTSEAS